VNANDPLRYYVYGVELKNSSMFKIGVADTNPETRKAELYSALQNSEPLCPEKYLSETGVGLDLFSLEDFSNLDAAQEAASFWLSYLQSLGLTVQRAVN
jgi:hypothetical protein